MEFNFSKIAAHIEALMQDDQTEMINIFLNDYLLMIHRYQHDPISIVIKDRDLDIEIKDTINSTDGLAGAIVLMHAKLMDNIKEKSN